MKRSWILTLLMVASLISLNSRVFADDEDVNQALGSMTSRIAAVEKKQSVQIEVHGFAETDVMNDSEQTGKVENIANIALPANTNLPVGNVGTIASKTGTTQYSLRNSRVDFLAKTTVDGWATKGYIEGDFLGFSQTGSNLYTAPTFRIRHAYLDVQKDGWDFMAGQYWTLFGWNMDYVLATVQPQPIMGTMYERTPRIGVMKTFGDEADARVQIAVDAERPEQSASMIPNFNGGIRFLLGSWKGAFTYATGATKYVPLSVGLSGTMRTYLNGASGANPTANTSYSAQAVAADIQIPILPNDGSKDDISLVVTGEYTIGKGYGDELNGWTGGLAAPGGSEPFEDAGIAGLAAGTFTLVDTQSMNAQLQFHFPKSTGLMIGAGYGETYSDNVNTLAGGTYNDDANFFANIMEDFTPEVRVGVEYVFYQTSYMNGTFGQDTRFQLGTWYRF